MKKPIEPFTLKDEAELVCLYNIWPDDIEYGRQILEYAFQRIDSFTSDPLEYRASRKAEFQNSFNKTYAISSIP